MRFLKACFVLSALSMTQSCFAEGVMQTASASATVLTAVSASVNSSLSFGTFQVSDPGGTVMINQSSGCTESTTGNVTATFSGSCASLNVTGSSGQAIAVTLDNPNFTLADNSTHTASGILDVSSNTCYASGGFPLCSDLRIGGTLTLGNYSSNPAGSYSTSNAGGSAGSINLEYN
ncbi:MAG: hypothetical protein K0Q57_355 [Gammaproteobacteria bacterium]|nr:hypothetical protein [Gammaproteobacteria bacterium]